MERTYMYLGLWVLLLISPTMATKTKNIYFGHITSFGESGYNSSGAIPAVELAVEHINNNTSILPGYTLVSTPVMDSGCDHIQSLDAFFSSVVYTSDRLNIIALLGCGCAVATIPVAEISYRWNITQISYASGSSALSNRAQFKNYFRTWPSFIDIASALVSVLKHYNWKRILFLTQNVDLFTKTSADVTDLIIMEQAGITVEENIFPSSQVNFSSYNDFFRTSADFRVFFLNMYEQWGNRVLCEAASKNLTYPRYTWIIYGWYSEQWWMDDAFNGSSSCSLDEKLRLLDRSIIIQHYPIVKKLGQTTISGYTVSEYMQMYTQKRMLGSYGDTAAQTFAYDAVWTLALALNKTDEQIKSNASITKCKNLQGYTNITLDQFRYNNAQLSCLLKNNLQDTNFSGVSGQVYFDINGTRIVHKISILQYRKDGYNLVRNCIGYIDLDQSSTYPFYDDCNETSVTAFPNGIPLDGTPLNVTSSNNFGMAVTYYVLASVGIILVFVCAVFNIGFRKRKVVRLTSPKLNYFILVGALLLYTGMYANIVLTTSASLGTVQCHFQTWLIFLGYAFVLGTVIAKLWRVYHIFHNPSTAKKPIHDWQLIILVLTLSGIQAMLLFLGSAVPLLQPGSYMVQNAENPILIKDPKSGLTIYYYIYTCYQQDTPSYYWLILLMAYTAFLQCLGMILAFQTRKVNIPVLNDSKHVAAVIYISSITLLTLVFTHFGFSAYLDISHGILDGVIFVNTTAYLGLIFFPKMISLYKDPQGIKIFDKTASSAKDSADKGGIAMANNESMARLPPNNNQEPSDIMSMSSDGVVQ